MIRLRTFAALAELSLAAACVTMRQPGTLSPISSRVTNEVISVDAETFERWGRRIDALSRSSMAASQERAYALARATVWLDYARDAYAYDPRDGASDAALDETRRLVIGLEGGTLPPLVARPTRSGGNTRPDLWVRLDSARGALAMNRSPGALAEVEIALVRANHLTEASPNGETRINRLNDVERACAQQVQVKRAESLLTELLAPQRTRFAVREQPARLAVGQQPARFAVRQQGVPAAPVVAVASVVPVARVTPVVAVAPAASRVVLDAFAASRVRRVVHFAANSATLAYRSRVKLGEVISILRAHPKLNLLIEGYTDHRGTAPRNSSLAVKRADAVRRYLESARLDLGRITLMGIGPDSAATSHASMQDLARDRRVTLAFTGSDGQPLTLPHYQIFDVEHERDLQVERTRRRNGHLPRSKRRRASLLHTSRR